MKHEDVSEFQRWNVKVLKTQLTTTGQFSQEFFQFTSQQSTIEKPVNHQSQQVTWVHLSLSCSILFAMYRDGRLRFEDSMDQHKASTTWDIIQRATPLRQTNEKGADNYVIPHGV